MILKILMQFLLQRIINRLDSMQRLADIFFGKGPELNYDDLTPPDRHKQMRVVLF